MTPKAADATEGVLNLHPSSSLKFNKKYTTSMGVHRYEKIDLINIFFIYLSMGVRRKENLISFIFVKVSAPCLLMSYSVLYTTKS